MKQENLNTEKISVNNKNLSKFKNGTIRYVLLMTTLASVQMFFIGKIFGTDGAIITGILMSIALNSAIRYNN